MSASPSRRRQFGDFTTQFGAFVFFALFPALFTGLAPRYTVELQRDASGVSASVRAHTLFFIPYWRQHETGVRRVEVEIHEGERVGYNAHLSERMNEPNRRGYTEDNAEIHFLGDGEGVGAMIEIGRLDDVLAQAQGFLDNPESRSLSLSFFAHRVMGLYIGLPLSLLVLLYLPLLGLALVRLVLRRPYWPFA